MRDQLILYDQAVVTWAKANFPPLLPGRVTQILVAIGRKGFVEVTTGQLTDNRTRTLPRIAITRLSQRNDPTRYNSNRIRRLGFKNPPNQNSMLSGKFPTPTSITYQVDLHTRYVKEMNLWERFVMDEFAPSYMYLKIRPNDVWGDKIYYNELEGDIDDNSDLEPDEQERQIRKTFTFRSDAWYFDDKFISVPVVKAFEVGIFDKLSGDKLDTSFLPPIEPYASSVNGTDVTFASTLERKPILRHGMVISALFSGKTIVTQDNGSGTLFGDKVSSGTIDYATGEVTVTFSSPPDENTDITVTYFTDVGA